MLEHRRRVHARVPGHPRRAPASDHGRHRAAGRVVPRAQGAGVSPLPEFAAKAVQRWLAAVGTQTAYITPGNPWENGYIESFNARLRDELLDGEIFFSLEEARIVIESWRRHYNAVRPHGALRYQALAPEVLVTGWAAWPGCVADQHPDPDHGAKTYGELTFQVDHRVPKGPNQDIISRETGATPPKASIRSPTQKGVLGPTAWREGRSLPAEAGRSTSGSQR